MSPIPDPGEALARLAVYLGLPVTAAIFFLLLWNVVAWFRIAVAAGAGASVAAELAGQAGARLGARGRGEVAYFCLTQAIYFVGGLYLAQCFQLVAGLPYASGDTNQADRTVLVPADYFAAIYFRPFEYTSAVAAVLLTVCALWTVDAVTGWNVARIPWIATYVLSVPAAGLTALGLIPALVGTLVGCLRELTGNNFDDWPTVGIYWLVGLALVPWALSALMGLALTDRGS